MKNTVLANFRCFPQEYTPIGEYGIPKNWDCNNRYFFFSPFHLRLIYIPSRNYCWKVILHTSRDNDRGNYLCQTPCSKYPSEACFLLPSDRAALRLLRMLEEYSTEKYLQTVFPYGVFEGCNWTSQIKWALDAEFSNMVKKIERFCASYHGCKTADWHMVPAPNLHNQTLYNG